MPLPRRGFGICAIFLAELLAIGALGCARQPAAATPPVAPTLSSGRVPPEHTSGWVETELYFGLGPADHPHQGISETEWRAFLDKEVTPRFPAGLSVVDAYGQWQGKNDAAPERLRSKMLIIDYPGTPENRAKIEAIRAAWKRKTGDQSVMRVTAPADVAF